MPRFEHTAVKDDDAEHPIASAWRPTIRAVVQRLAAEDYALRQTVPNVTPLSAASSRQIEESITDFGETLVELPDETWECSVAQWMGTHWDILVDLWTEESGRCDLALQARVFEVGPGFRVVVDMVYVP